MARRNHSDDSETSIILLVLWIIFLSMFFSDAEAADVLKVTGGVGLEYNDLLANTDISYLNNYDSNYTYGISAGMFRMKDYYVKDKHGVDKYKVEGFHTGYLCGRVGVSIRPSNFVYADFITGPCYFDRAKILISGHIQFNTEVSYGLRDTKTGSMVGVTYRHFSNAGLVQPNLGANLYLLTMGVAF